MLDQGLVHSLTISTSKKPRVTVLFDNDPLLFQNPEWNAFYAVCVRWVNDAAKEHGDGFSVKFTSGPGPTACVRWNEKEIGLYQYASRIAVAWRVDTTSIDDFDPVTSTWQEVLAPLVQSRKAWKVWKLERDLEVAKKELKRERAIIMDEKRVIV